MRELNEQQAKFVAYFTSVPGAIGNGAAAARGAGYSEKSARDIARQLLLKPHIQAAVDQALRAQISGALASKAVEVLENIINDPETLPKIRLDAAKTILDRSGVIAPKAKEPAKAGEIGRSAFDGMSAKEIREYIAIEKEKLARLAETAAPRSAESASA